VVITVGIIRSTGFDGVERIECTPAAERLYQKSDSAIMVMKPAENRHRYDAARVLDGAMDRSVFVERPMSPQLVIVGGILRQNPAQVRFAQDNHMVNALASDRSDARI
jgi:hypothetical protein